MWESLANGWGLDFLKEVYEVSGWMGVAWGSVSTLDFLKGVCCEVKVVIGGWSVWPCCFAAKWCIF